MPRRRGNSHSRIHTLLGVGVVLLLVAYQLQLGGPSARTVRHEPWNASNEVPLFDAHIASIEGVVHTQYQSLLAPWKTNQNVSVDVLDNGFGDAVLRVICLQKVVLPAPRKPATAERSARSVQYES